MPGSADPRRKGAAERLLAGWLNRGVEVAGRMTLWPRWLKRLAVMGIDGALAILAVWLAFSLRLGEWRLLDWPVVRFAGTMLALWFPAALWRRVYHAIFRYTGRGSIVSLAVTVAVVTGPLVAIYTVGTYPGVPRTIAALAPIIFLLMMCTARIVGRYFLVDLLHMNQRDGGQRRVLIYGAGGSGQQLASALATERNLQVVGFIDDDPGKRRQNIDRRPVFGPDEIDTVVGRTEATDVILAIGRLPLRRRREILDLLEPHPVNVQILPPVRDVLDGRITADALRPVQVEDLLGRTPVEPDAALLRASVTGKVVLVTGGGGSIGGELCRQVVGLAPAGLVVAEVTEHALFALQQALGPVLARLPETDRPAVHYRLVNIADPAALARLFADHAVQTIYHAAAYKHVPLVEENPLAAIVNNVFGTRTLARQAVASGVERFILISTDKAVRPPNVMGASKRVCEMMVQALQARHGGAGPIFAMVRFGNVLGSSGSVVPVFRQQIEAGGPITLTHRDITRYFMTIPEAAQLVLQAGGMARGGEVFVLDMGEPVRIRDLARSMIRLAGLTVREPGHEDGDIEIVETGLRPAEKLFEELLIGENAVATVHPRIMQAQEDFLPWERLDTHLAVLERAVAAADAGHCRTLLQRLVPTLEVRCALDADRIEGHGRADLPRLAAYGTP